MHGLDGYLTSGELSEYLGISTKKVCDLADEGRLPSVPNFNSRHRRFDAARVVEALREQKMPVPDRLLARATGKPLMGFTREQLEDELKLRGLDYRGFLEQLARGAVEAGQDRIWVDDGIKRAAQRVLTGDARQVAS